MDLILSDIHSNLHALRAVLKYAQRRAMGRFVFLGDLVGYGAHPNQVLDKVRALKPRVMVRGNHDRASTGHGLEVSFSFPARMAAEWTRQKLTRENNRFVASVPSGPRWVGRDYQIVHGSPLDEDAYLLHPREVLMAFDALEADLCFFGHTHLPGVYELGVESRQLRWVSVVPGRWYNLREGCRYLVNPGSIGQPRDRDPRASFMTFDPPRRRFRLHRLEYDIPAAARAILDAGLNSHLAERLFFGL